MLAIFSGLIYNFGDSHGSGRVIRTPHIYIKFVLDFYIHFNINDKLTPFVKHAPHTFGQLVKHFPQTPQVVVVARPLLDWS